MDEFSECSNRAVMCATWAARGECTNNPSWMFENCRQACNRCGTTRQQVCYGGGGSNTPSPPATTQASIRYVQMVHFFAKVVKNSLRERQKPIPDCFSGGGTCINQHYCCLAWAARGYCTTSAAYMAQYCPPSMQSVPWIITKSILELAE
ncbi:shTK domain protein [Ostertagia ostertagi]